MAKKEQKVEDKDKVPAPELILDKKLVILPFQNLSGKVEYDFIAESFPSLLFSYLKFANSFPFYAESAKLKNSSKFFGYFGKDKNLNTEERAFYINKSFTESARWRLAYEDLFQIDLPSLKEEEEKKAKYFKIKVLAPLKDPSSVADKDVFILKGAILKGNRVEIFVYDTATHKKVFSFHSKLPPINYHLLEKGEDLGPLVLKNVKKFLEKFSGKKFHKVRLQAKQEQVIFYINDNFVDSLEVLLPEGEQKLKAVRSGYYTYQGKFKVEKDGKLNISLKARDAKVSVSIKTKPEGSPVFLDSRFVGYSPVKVKVEPGTHQVRISAKGYEHLNYILNVRPFEQEKKILVQLKRENEGFENYRDTVHLFKNVAFYSFFPSLAIYIYSKERFDYYLEKLNVDPTNQSALKKYNFYSNSYQFFRGASVFLLVTAAILQIVELNMDDVGVGVDEDRNLGVFFRF